MMPSSLFLGRNNNPEPHQPEVGASGSRQPGEHAGHNGFCPRPRRDNKFRADSIGPNDRGGRWCRFFLHLWSLCEADASEASPYTT